VGGSLSLSLSTRSFISPSSSFISELIQHTSVLKLTEDSSYINYERCFCQNFTTGKPSSKFSDFLTEL
jgi:hypothetical protein